MKVKDLTDNWLIPKSYTDQRFPAYILVTLLKDIKVTVTIGFKNAQEKKLTGQLIAWGSGNVFLDPGEQRIALSSIKDIRALGDKSQIIANVLRVIKSQGDDAFSLAAESDFELFKHIFHALIGDKNPDTNAILAHLGKEWKSSKRSNS